jgi:hypothetical protein
MRAAPASSKPLILKRDRAFIGDFRKHNALNFAEARPDNPKHFCGFPAVLPPNPLCLTPLSNFAGAPLKRRPGLRVDPPVYLDPLTLRGASRARGAPDGLFALGGAAVGVSRFARVPPPQGNERQGM